jgi:hypothetical protein
MEIGALETDSQRQRMTFVILPAQFHKASMNMQRMSGSPQGKRSCCMQVAMGGLLEIGVAQAHAIMCWDLIALFPIASWAGRRARLSRSPKPLG